MSGGLSVGQKDFLRELVSNPLTLAHYVVVQRSLCVGEYDCPLLLV